MKTNQTQLNHILEMLDTGVYDQKKAKKFILSWHQEKVKELKERISCPDCGDLYMCSCYNPRSARYKPRKAGIEE